MRKIFLTFLILLPLKAFSLPPLGVLQAEYKNIDWAQSVSSSVVIHAAISEVWNYVSDSHNASEWSIYFHHISPLPGILDGQIGSRRRCFRNANESGARWDEVTIHIENHKKRGITTYNLAGFPLSFIAKGKYVYVNQIYRPIDANTTELTFQTAYTQENGNITKWGFKKNQKKTREIFQKNLMNIKAVIEGNPLPFQRDL